jgi:hypothetical protein
VECAGCQSGYDLYVRRRVGVQMRHLPEVQRARELMNEAIDWSTFKWLFEKSRVRKTADLANAALDKLQRATKARWSDEAKAEYKKLSGKAAGATRRQQQEQLPQTIDPQVGLLIEKVAEADKAAHRARMDAEETFERAERQMNISLAKEGCQKAIRSWELHEKAIRRAEAVTKPAA